MTLTDIRRNILESKDPNWFNNVETTFNFSYVNTKIPLKGVSTVYEFVLKQIEGWSKYGHNMPTELSNSISYFNEIRGQIVSLISNHKNSELNILQNHWNNINAFITDTRLFPLKFNSPEVEFLLKVNQEYPGSFGAAYNFTINSNNFNLNNKQSLIGAILAYEFSLKDTSQIVKRSASERSSIKTIENELEKHFSEAESHLSSHLKMINEKYTEYAKNIDSFKQLKEKSFAEWFEKSKDDFSTFNENSNASIKTLESTYEELLSLKKPAEYWKLRATELKKEGWNALKLLIALVAFACAVLYSLLWLTPESMLHSFFSDDKSSAIRWSIIFITLISFLAFTIKALTKITFSSFHLARDAEERERLTFVYLAMIKDSSVDKEDRHLIMQSLFSRADTGLLKDDSSPTMPGTNSLIERITK